MAKIKTKTEDEIVNSIYINPLTDFGFKKLFLNKELLIAFLNDVVGTSIKDIQYQATEGLGEQIEDRTAIFDLLCITDTNEYFIVEMQLGKQTYFKDRVLFYASHVIRKQAPRRKYWNYELKAVYVVSILDFITFAESSTNNEVIERVYLYREKAKKRYSNKLNLIFIELPKFKKQVSELKNNTDVWLFLLKYTSELNACPTEIKEKIFKRFLELAEIQNLTSMEMETYKKSLKQNRFLRDMANCVKEDGRMEGRMEGKMEGRMEGRMEERRQIAARLLQRKTSVEEVVSLTDLTKEQVQELLKQN
ncbi:MAG: Rpn family recombination-promoting nuclease/putative transposase [Candidatus Azobacteroides sp.]|nr:Rpn family recombination-promoting nuclease/putative transposase [Candidatus Azobacteroides sp.]